MSALRLFLPSVCLTAFMCQMVAADELQSLYGAARADAKRLSSSALAQPLTAEQLHATEQERRQKWLQMLGLDPLPPRSDLQATVTGVLDRGDYVVEKVHFQCIPGAYVIGNLYRPAKIAAPLPAILYLCGHSKGKVNPPYQANPRWFAQHGYIALVLDPIQLGESQGFHHGTYREDRWDWQSRGYTPAGTEVWNAMRALDYLESRDDVDATRFGVTGLSGGGVISWCLAAADTRIRCVAPVCQSGSIEQVVLDRGTDGHCDCAFWINYYRWCWSDIGALIAPRALMIASGSEDVLWRPAGYRNVAERIGRQYRAIGTDENFSLVEDGTPHGYTPKLRLAIFAWFNKHLKGDTAPVQEDVTDFVEPEQNLLAFGGNLPQNDRMRGIDRLLVARPPIPEIRDQAEWATHQQHALELLRQTTFRNCFPSQQTEPSTVRFDGDDNGGLLSTYEYQSADGLTLAIKLRQPHDRQSGNPLLLFAMPADERSSFGGGGNARPRSGRPLVTAAVEVRNSASSSVGAGYLWTLRRTYPLLGHSLAERQVSDLLSAIKILRAESSEREIILYGQKETAAIAMYAALLDPDIAGVVLQDCPESHEDPNTPAFLGVLRVGDLAQNLALLYPRPITIVGKLPPALTWTRDMYTRLGNPAAFRVIDSLRDF
ncbi:MAG: acetylxylan esterase [Planctomycetales bacterium]|nr:acetylxylan esterase [Planctomycetales bacterium]